MRTTFVGTIEHHDGALCAKDPYNDARIALGSGGPPPIVGTVAQFSVNGETATVAKVLAQAGSAKSEMYGIAARHGLDPVFPEDVMAEVEAITNDPGIQSGVERGELVDLRHMAFVTIDNDDSRDLDQAMYIVRDDDGGHIVHYALADASYYVKPGSALWREALSRKTSFYLPGLAVPMLPRPLSEDLVSLNEGVDRRALVFSMRLARDGTRVDTHVERACIRSRKKLAYDGVQAYHNDIVDGRAQQNNKHHGHDFTETLTLLKTVGELRMGLAHDRDVPAYQRTPLYVSYEDKQGHAFTLVADARNAVEKWNEQVSLLCNTEGAAKLLGFAGDPHVQSVYRNHDAPPVARMRQFAEFVEELVQRRDLDPMVFRWRRDESLADYLARLPHDGEQRRVATAIHQKAIYTNVGALFAAEATGHFGVGTKDGYARFSSPMREVVGIFTHKELLDGMLGTTSSPEDDAALRAQVLNAANGAKRTQSQITKEANKLAIDALFEQDMRSSPQDRPTRRGTLLDIERNKVLFRLDEPPIEVKIYGDEVTALTGRQIVAESSVSVREGQSAWHIGEGVDLQVAGYNEKKGRWIIVPLGTAPAGE